MLAAAFLFFHRLDLARAIDAWRALAAFVHARGLARGPALAESAAALVVAALVVLAWYGAGAGLLRIVHRRWPSARPHVVATACAIGALVWSLVWFVLGLAGAYHTAPALVALAIGVSLAVAATTRRSARGAVAEVTPSLAIDTSVIAPAAMIAIAVAAAALAALAPPTAKDSLQYHLALPKAFLAASRLVEVSGNIASYYPLAVESNGMWAMLIGRALSARAGEAAFGAITFAFLPLLLAFVYGWTTEMGVSRGWASTAAALIATAPVVYDVAASAGYVDLALALYVAIATRAAVRWWATGER